MPRSATTAEIKSSFREQAKHTHPDVLGATDATRHFRDLVDAYRVLRDPKKRAQYDHEYEAWRTDPRRSTASPEAAAAEAAAQAAAFAHGAQGGQREVPPLQNMIAVGGVGFFAFCMLVGSGDVEDQWAARPQSAVAASGVNSTGIARGNGDAHIGEANVAEKMVRAYFNPFTERWNRIPDGFEAPSSMDLTAWHRKRTDSVEWSRLLAIGKLSQIIPRNGLQVRLRPAWDTFEPVLIKDPSTGKTVNAQNRLPRPATPGVCEIQF